MCVLCERKEKKKERKDENKEITKLNVLQINTQDVYLHYLKQHGRYKICVFKEERLHIMKKTVTLYAMHILKLY